MLQALWRTLRNPAESISHVAYRVLGKFGGSNRKMLKESQRLHYIVTEVQGPSIKSEFTDCKASIQLPMEKVRPWMLALSPPGYMYSSVKMRKEKPGTT